ncbi:hypothetical protein M3Y99_00178600 [Aphelenchoides fujianensis]|nr:hypothetical protein M3Y99_00178600 [Aphelenchoides fujianensis]
MTDTRRALRTVLVASLISVACSQYYAANQQQARYYYIPQQAQYQPWQLAQQQQRYAYQQQFYAPRPAPPTAVQPPLQQALQPAAPVRQPAEKKATTRVSNVYEFDLPPAPPSRFLSEDDRSKILSVNKHGRPEHAGNSPTQVRSRLVNGATERQTADGVSRQQPQAPPPPPPPVQVHHLQLPRFIPKPVVQTPSQITHLHREHRAAARRRDHALHAARRARARDRGAARAHDHRLALVSVAREEG